MTAITVGELISQLREFPSDMPLVWYVWDYSINHFRMQQVESVRVDGDRLVLSLGHPLPGKEEGWKPS